MPHIKVFASLSLFRRRPCRKRTSLSCRELKQKTDVFLTNVTMGNDNFQGSEACLIEQDKFVGTTAKFDDLWNIISLHPESRPKEYSTIHVQIVINL